MDRPLRLAIVTDIHHGRVSYTKLGPEALSLLDRAIAEIDDRGHDLIVELGDRISDVDRDTDRQLTAEVAAAFAPSATPHHHILGNHDVAYLTAADNEELFGHPMGSTSMDRGGIHLVMWQMNTRIERGRGFVPDPADLEWLAADLASTELPAVVFSHVPLDGGSLRGNYWFQNNEIYGGLANVEEIQAVFREAGNVVLCVAGHVHRNQLNTIDGVHHITVQSLSDSYSTGGQACGAWATIEVGEREISWTTHGLDPISMTLPRKAVGSHWEPPLAPFGSRRRTTTG